MEEKQQSRKKGSKLLTVIIVLCIIVILVSGYFIVSYLLESKAASDEYNNIIIEVKHIDDDKSKTSIDFDKLLAINSDIVGWIEIPGTVIDYPIVKGTDNEYYQYYTVEKEKLSAASIFMDYTNAGDFSDANTVVYGHNMKNGSMFHSIESYFEDGFYSAHSYMNVYSATGAKYKGEIFAVFSIAADYDYRNSYFENDDAFEAFITDMKSRSIINVGMEILPGDRIITLSTCSHFGHNSSNQRLVVMAKLVEENT